MKLLGLVIYNIICLNVSKWDPPTPPPPQPIPLSAGGGKGGGVETPSKFSKRRA